MKARRAALKLTQLDLARLSGFQACAISHFEAGRRDPTAASVRRLCISLSCSADYLLGLTD